MARKCLLLLNWKTGVYKFTFNSDPECIQNYIDILQLAMHAINVAVVKQT